MQNINPLRKPFYKLGTGIGFAMLSPLVLATQEEVLETIWRVSAYVFILFVIVIIVAVYFMRSRDKRRTPLGRIFEERKSIHLVGPDTSVTACVQKMTVEKIGALIIMDGDRLIGIFTERDGMILVLG